MLKNYYYILDLLKDKENNVMRNYSRIKIVLLSYIIFCINKKKIERSY